MPRVYPYGVPTPTTTAYLERLFAGGPLTLFTRQPLYLFSPAYSKVTEDEVADYLGAPIQAYALNAKSWFNTLTGLPEFDVVMRVDSPQLLLPENAKPYIALAVDGHRSQSSRLFLRSVADALIADQFPLVYTLAFDTLQSDVAQHFNPNAGEDDESSWS